MRAAKGATILVVLMILAMAGPVFGKDLQPLTDSELDSVHARGLTFLIDTNTVMTTAGFSAASSGNSPGSWNMNFSGPNSFDLRNSILMSGTAQQNAFVPVNAVGSAVNVPINIVVVLGNVAAGGINISNVLTATNSH